VDAHFRRRHLRDAVEIALYTAEPAPMGVAGPEVSAAVRRMVEEKDIRYYPERQVVRVDPRERRVELADGTVAEFDLLIYVPPICAPRVVREAGLTNESGWVTVDRNTLETRFPHVYAVGDVTLIPLSLGKPLPKAGVFADAQAEVVARNIARQITGNGKPARFDGHGACFVEAGAGRAGYGAGNFYAEPRPVVRMRGPGRLWHLGKVLFEKYALRAWL
jgi:sulfide:quinone oxidoreductase